MNKRWQNILTIALLAAAVIAVAWIVLSDVMTHTVVNDKNPYEYDVTAFTRTDPKSVCYVESEKILLNMREPTGMAVDDQDNIFVTGDLSLASYDRSGAQRYTVDTGVRATCLTYGPDGKVYLGLRDRVHVHRANGELIAAWPQLDSLAVITSLAVKPPYAFIADAGNRVVWRYNLDGRFEKRLAEKDSSQGIPGLIIPSPYFDIAVDSDGYLWLANTGRHAFENYTLDGELRSTWEKISMTVEGFSGCCNPTHFTLLPDGSFITSEKGIVRVKILKPTGEFQCVVAGPEQFDNGTVGLDLAVDSRERILVLDPFRKMIRIFIKKV